MRELVARVVGLFLFLAPTGAVVAQTSTEGAEQFAPITFPAKPTTQPFFVAADGRLGLGDSGSIEIGLTLPDRAPGALPPAMTLLSQESEDKRRFRIVITGGGQRLGIVNEAGTRDIAFDFRDGGFFQIGLSTLGVLTKVYINGALIGEIDTGYGPPADLPLHLGGQADGLAGFCGEIDYFRVWDRPLELEEYARTFDEFGLPKDSPALLPDLRLYGLFTDKRVTAYFTQAATLADIVDGEFFGVRAGNVFVDVIPRDTTLHGFIATGTDRIESFQILVKDGTGAIVYLPVHGVPAKSTNPPSLFTLADDETLDEISGTYAGDVTWVTNPDGTTTGTVTQRLASLRFRTSNGRMSEPFGSEASANGAAGSGSFAYRFGSATRFDAIYGFIGNGLTGIGLAPAVPVKANNIGGRWIEETVADHAEKLDDQAVAAAGAAVPHGNYRDRPVTVLHASNRARTLDIYKDNTFGQTMRLQPDGSYAVGPSRLAFEDDNTFVLDGTRFIRIQPYEALPDTPEFIPLSGTFTLEAQLPFYRASFYGYDISRIDPRNLQNFKGQTKPVLRSPKIGSREYYPVPPKLVPQGTLFASDVMTRSSTQVTTIRSSAEHAEKMSDTLGMSIGVPKVAAFGLDSDVTTLSKSVAAAEQQIAATQEVQTTHALVIDLGHAQLDDGFRQTIERLNVRRRAGQPVDYLRDVIAVYGTHYAYAVTVGMTASNTIRFSKQAASDLAEKKKSLGLTAKGIVDGVQAKGSYTHSSDFSDTVNSELETQFTRFASVGSNDKPVPVFMDLRVLSDLLSPLFFDDRDIYAGMRWDLLQAIYSYVTARAPLLNSPDDIWEPYLYSVTLGTLTFDISHAGQEDAFYGRIGYDLFNQAKSLDIVQQWPEDDAILLLPNNPFDPDRWKSTKAVQLSTAPKYVLRTARELCNKSRPPIRLGMFFHLQLAKIGNKPTLDSAFNSIEINPATLTAADKPFSVNLVFRKGSQFPLPITLTASARRLADPDGAFKPVPPCR